MDSEVESEVTIESFVLIRRGVRGCNRGRGKQGTWIRSQQHTEPCNTQWVQTEYYGRITATASGSVCTVCWIVLIIGLLLPIRSDRSTKKPEDGQTYV